MKKFRRFLEWLRPLMPYLNIALAIAAYFLNEFALQVFCQPVLWAGLVLLASVGAFLVWPWLGRGPVAWRYLALFLQGAMVPVCAYCLLFLGPGLLITGLLFSFLILPAMAWLPVWFAAQAINRAISSRLRGGQVAFMLGTVPLLVAQGWAEQQYRAIETAVAGLPAGERRQPASLARVVPRSFMAERLAGALFKYHNFEELVYDGWRPPLHDPLANVSLWLRAGRDWRWHGSERARSDWYANPLLVGNSVNSQAAFYHRLFPNEPVKVDCACSHTGDGQHYYAWEPGLTDNWGTSLVEVERQQKEFDAEMTRARAKKVADSIRVANQLERQR
jgi:hypothetical protein